MQTIFYNYSPVYKNILSEDQTVEKIDNWTRFRAKWTRRKPSIIIIPLGVFDLVGLDIRYEFRSVNLESTDMFLLIGTKEQVEFSLSQNMGFLKHKIDHINVPINAELLPLAIQQKVARFKKDFKEQKN